MLKRPNNCFADKVMNFVCDSCSPGELANVVPNACICRGLHPLAAIVLCASFNRHIVLVSQIKASNIISIEDG